MAPKLPPIGTQDPPGIEAPQQLSLGLLDPPPWRRESSIKRSTSNRERIALLDQRMTTAEVLRVVGVHRVTLFRWTRKGAFPPKHFSGGWLRSDIEYLALPQSAGAGSGDRTRTTTRSVFTTVLGAGWDGIANAAISDAFAPCDFSAV
jgi:predicted DNA-binding transcriptional regulator AlpA